MQFLLIIIEYVIFLWYNALGTLIHVDDPYELAKALIDHF